MAAGRPTDYNEKIADKILSRLSAGESMLSVCEDKNMPCRASIFRWLSKHKEFRDNYTRAKCESADSDAEKLQDIAEQVLIGKIDPQAARVAADIIKWSAAKKRPSKFGDKISVGGDANNPVLTDNKWTVEFVNAASEGKSKT